MQRLFFAVPMPAEAKASLEELISRLRHRIRDVKWVRSNAMHVTLKFLGDTQDDLVERVAAAAREAVAGVAPLELSLVGLSAFPSPERPRVIWTGIAGNAEELVALAARLDAGLQPLGVTPEERLFSPHATLARARRGQKIRPISEHAAAYRDREIASFRADALVLYRSELRPEGPIYTALEVFRFCAARDPESGRA